MKAQDSFSVRGRVREEGRSFGTSGLRLVARGAQGPIAEVETGIQGDFTIGVPEGVSPIWFEVHCGKESYQVGDLTTWVPETGSRGLDIVIAPIEVPAAHLAHHSHRPFFETGVLNPRSLRLLRGGANADKVLSKSQRIHQMARLGRLALAGVEPAAAGLRKLAGGSGKADNSWLGDLQSAAPIPVGEDVPARHFFSLGPIIDAYLGMQRAFHSDEEKRRNCIAGLLAVAVDLASASCGDPDPDSLAGSLVASRPTYGPGFLDVASFLHGLAGLAGEESAVGLMKAHLEAMVLEGELKIRQSGKKGRIRATVKPPPGDAVHLRFWVGPRRVPVHSDPEGALIHMPPGKTTISVTPIPIDSLTQLVLTQKRFADALPNRFSGSILEVSPLYAILQPSSKLEAQVDAAAPEGPQNVRVLDEQGFVVADARAGWRRPPSADETLVVKWEDPPSRFDMAELLHHRGQSIVMAPGQALPDHLAAGIRVPDFRLDILRISVPEEVCTNESYFAEIPIRVTPTPTEDLRLEVVLTSLEGTLDRVSWTEEVFVEAGSSEARAVVSVSRLFEESLPDRGSWPNDPPPRVFSLRILAPGERVLGEGRTRVYVPRQKGRWRRGGVSGTVAVHAAMLPNGRVLFFGYDESDPNQLGQGEFQVWDPATMIGRGSPGDLEGQIRNAEGTVGRLDYNPFCAGQAFLSDGRLVVAGGHAHDQEGEGAVGWGVVGLLFGVFEAAAAGFSSLAAGQGDSKEVFLVTANADGTATWTELGKDMDNGRWYPTCTTLANGSVMILGGSRPFLSESWHALNDDFEIVDTRGRLRRRGDFARDVGFVAPTDGRAFNVENEMLPDLYPLCTLLPASDGRAGLVLVVTDSFARVLDPNLNAVVVPALDLGGNRTWYTQGSIAMLPIEIDEDGNGPDFVHVAVVGGGSTGRGNNRDAALSDVAILTFRVSTRALTFIRWPVLTAPPRLRTPADGTAGRFMSDAVLLPNGEVLIVNGARFGYANDNERRTTFPMILDIPMGPSSRGSGRFPVRTSRTLSDGVIERGYHSTALLLPNGSVLVAGSTLEWESRFLGHGIGGGAIREEKRLQVFEPPYMGCGTRPTIQSAPGIIFYGGRFVVEASRSDVQPHVVLMRCGSTTHSLNTDQRMLRLAARRLPEPWLLAVRAPVNPTYAPPGPYMMFIIGRDGAPSDARFVSLRRRPATAVSVVRG